MNNNLNQDLNTIIDSIKLFSELGLQMKNEQKDECFRAIKYMQKQLESSLMIKDVVSNNFDLSKMEVIIISHFETEDQNKLIKLLNEHDIEYFTFNSFQEFQEFIEDNASQFFIFVSEQIYNFNFLLLKKYEHFLIFSSNHQNNNKAELKFYNSKRVNFNIKINSEILKIIQDEKSKGDLTLTKYEHLNALIIDDNSLHLRVLTQFFKFMNINFNAVKKSELGYKILKNNNFHAIFINSNLVQNENKLLANYLAKHISKDTLKVCIHTEKEKESDFNKLIFDEIIDNITNLELFCSIFDRYFYSYKINKENRINKEKYYELFFNDIKTKYEDLTHAFEERDFLSIKSLTHNLKSGSGVLKETRLLAILYNIDDSIAKENHILIDKNIKLLKDEIDNIEGEYFHEYSTNRR